MLITSTAMRALEARAFAGGVSADALMEEAGLGIARVVRQFFPWPGLCLAVFGKGNNGGDALVAVRHLAEVGWEVKLIPAFPEEEWGRQVRAKYESIGSPACGPIETLEKAAGLARGRPLVVLDGLLGTGSSGALKEPIAGLAWRINHLRAHSHAHVIALDLPTGLDGDTGVVAEGGVVADITATIGFAKTGLVADAAAAVVGRLAMVPLPALEAEAGDAEIVTPARIAPEWPRRSFDMHKGDCGRVGIMAGSNGMLGAAVLCANAAVRAGAGLVTLYATPETATRLAGVCAPEVMVQAVDTLREAWRRRHDVLAIGPGMGAAQAEEIREAIAEAEVPMVVDADALNALAEHWEALERAPAERVLTPHPGEMERLAPGALERGRRSAAEEFAGRFPSVTLLLKGARTVIAKRGERTSFNSTGSPGMATGGMGDTLTGVIAALIGQRVAPWEAARLGAWLCGRAAEAAIFQGGETEETLTPTRLTEYLARAFRDLRAGCF